MPKKPQYSEHLLAAAMTHVGEDSFVYDFKLWLKAGMPHAFAMSITSEFI